MAEINRVTGEPIRNERIYINTSAEEKEDLFRIAREAGFPSLSRYIRETGLAGNVNATLTAGTNLQWEAVTAVHRVASEVQKVGEQLTHGRQPDEELLLVAMQIQEVAEETLKELRAGKGAV